MKSNISLNAAVKKLPKKAEYSASGGLTWSKNKIMDCFPYVEQKKKMHTNDGVEEWITVAIYKGNKVITRTDVKVSEISKIDWFGISELCIINPDCVKAKHYLSAIIQYMSSNTPETIQCQRIEKTGFNKITISEKEINCFNTGDRLILPRDAPADITERIKLIQSEYVLKADISQYSEKEAIIGMIEAVSLNLQAGLFIMSFTIASLIKSLYRECGIPPKFVLYLCGPKDSLKTAYSSLLSPIFNRLDDKSKLLLQFNSTSFSVESLTNDYPDFLIIVDNIYLSEDSAINRQITGTFEKAVQDIGDDVGRITARGSNMPASSVIGTGEFDGIGNPSTIARYFTIPFGESLKNSKKQAILHEFQNKPLIISTFYYYLLQYIVDNIEDIKTSIKDLLTDFRKVSGNIPISPKLHERYFILLASYMLFLTYCKSRNIANNNDPIRATKYFSDQLILLCKRHNQTIVEKEKAENKADCPDDFLRLIGYWYNSGEFSIAKDENDKKLERREALIYNDCLCLRTKPLMKKINESFPKVTLKIVMAQLVAKKVLKSDADKNTAKIKGLRFLKIPLEKLR